MTTLAPTTDQSAVGAHRAALAPARALGHRAVPQRHLVPAALGDVAAVLAAVWVSDAPVWAYALAPLVLLALAARAHRGPGRASALDTVGTVVMAATTGAGALMLTAAAVAPSSLDPAPLAHAWLLSCALLCAHRGILVIARRGEPGEPTVILGSGAGADTLERMLAATPACGLRPVARIDLDLSVATEMEDARALAGLVLDAGGREVVLLPGAAGDQATAVLARACAEAGLGVTVRSALADAGGALAVELAGATPLVRLHAHDAGDPRLVVKHVVDRLVASLLLLALAPVLLAIALAVRIGSPGAVLFRQRRVGRDGREFDMLKFRSMRQAPSVQDALLVLQQGSAPGGVEGADRRTRLGTFLRRTSLDELPQLLNVARGEMSLVGPRPERPEFVHRFNQDVDRYADRHRLKAGMTGLAQVHGLRGKTSIADRVAYDNHYVEHWSPALDAKILLRTIGAVFRSAE